MMNKGKSERVSSQVMELKDLIAGPLVATIDADSLSAQRYLDCLFRIAFESYDPKTGKAGRLRMLTFNYRSHDLSGARTRSVSIPLLTLVPLPLLQIQAAEFDFDIQVLDASSTQRQSLFSFETGQSVQAPDDPAGNDTRFRVALAASSGGGADRSENRRGGMSANMRVHVKMRQADVPGGLSMLLNKAVNNMVADVSGDPDGQATSVAQGVPAASGGATVPVAPATPAAPAGGSADAPVAPVAPAAPAAPVTPVAPAGGSAVHPPENQTLQQQE